MAELAGMTEALPDLLDFAGGKLYFDEPQEDDVALLLAEAGRANDANERRTLLAQADALASDDLSVIVALYRFHYFAHEFDAGLAMADRAMVAAGRRLNLPGDWRCLTPADIARADGETMPMLRFYLWALKGRGYLLMRLGRFSEAIAPLETLVGLDIANRLNARPLLELAREMFPPDFAERRPDA